MITNDASVESRKYPVNVAVVGAGYWGKNHVRNFANLGALSHICDSDSVRLGATAETYPHVTCTSDYDEILGNPMVDAVVISTPAVTHLELVSKALLANKDVLVEKPMALSAQGAEKLVRLAEENDRILMVGHILLYHPAVIRLKEILDSGHLGKIQYIQSNRLSMGKVRSEENILWSFAPHDISMILYLLGEMPNNVYATGYCHLQRQVEDVTISILDFPSGVGAHIYVSWMNPFKEQRLVILGDKRMAVFEDSRPDAKLRIFHNSFEWIGRSPNPVKGQEEIVEIDNSEPLLSECSHFLECVTTRRQPRSDGHEGLRTLRVLNACVESLHNGHGSKTPSILPVAEKEPDYFVHRTAVVDKGATVGKDTSIWHFSHVMKDARIGRNCRIGQNCFVGMDVQIGDNCKVQNNVSVYEGITLEDNVFCGPSMVFTNVYNPRCEIPRMNELRGTLVRRGATLGANSTIVCGHTIGQYAFVGAGSVVLKDVPDYALMVGNPAKRAGWMCRCGVRLEADKSLENLMKCPSCGDTYRVTGEDGILPWTAAEEIKEVKLLDLRRQFSTIKPEIMEAITGVVESQHFIGGPQVEALEREVAEYCGSSHAIGVSSGTDALVVSLMALGVSAGDEVITTPFTFFATVGSILRLGAKPVFADIDPYTFNLDPRRLEDLITPRTKAIIPVHLFGQCAEMDALLEVANRRGIAVVEDAAQAIGASYGGKKAGTLGTLGCFSFFPSKNLGAFGDGGMVVTDDDGLAQKIRIIRNQGAKPKYFHAVVGGNFRLDAIQAAVLRVKLRHLDSWSEKRRSNAAYYTERFEQSGLAGEAIVTPSIVHEKHVFNQYVIRAERRDALKKYLYDNGIGTEVYYPCPMHLQECLKDYGHERGNFPYSEAATDSVLALPVFPELSQAEMDFVISKIEAFYRASQSVNVTDMPKAAAINA